MKTKFKFLLAAAMVAMMATACSEEQTSLSIEDIPGKATIMGQVFYQTGTEFNVTTSLEEKKFVEAANKKIFFEIANSEFNVGASGIMVYETTTDASGNYTFEIPIPSKATMSITIKAETFNGEMKMYDGMSNSTPEVPIYRTDYVTYSYDDQLTVNGTTPTVKDITYKYETRELHN